MTNPIPKTVKFTNSKASLYLDFLRAFAAFLVLLSHWKIMFFIDYGQIPHHRSWFAIPYILASAGHQSVLIFFVLSGYLVSGSIFRALDGNFWQWRSYLTHRFTRLYVVLIPGLIVGGVFDWIGVHCTHVASLYNGASPKSHYLNVSGALTAPVFLGNLIFTQNLLVPPFGSNGALWSLANEFWYYLLFPLGLLALRKGTAIPLRIVYVLLFLAIAYFVRGAILLLFPVWLAGVLLTRLPRLPVGSFFRLLATVVSLPVFFGIGRVSGISGLMQDYLLGALTFFFLWTLLSATGPAGNSKGVHLIRQAARCSFTLYVIHMPALLLLTAVIAGDRVWPPGSLHYDAIAISVLGMLLALTYVFASITEFHTDQARRWVESKLTRGR